MSVKELQEYNRILKQIKNLFIEDKHGTYYQTINGKVYKYEKIYIKRPRRNLTKEEIAYLKSHTVKECSEYFKKSTTWVYDRLAGDYTTKV